MFSGPLDTNSELDTHPDPRPQLRSQGTLLQRHHIGPAIPLGPNPRTGIQVSVPPSPIDWGHLRHTRGHCLPPRMKLCHWDLHK